MAFLDNIVPPTVRDKAKTLVAGRQPVILTGAALVLAVAVLAMLWLGHSSYTVLFSGLSANEGGRIIDELQKSNVPYRVDDGGAEILVPDALAGRTRLMLAARGMPKQNGDVWSLFDNEALGVSPFVEQAHYMRGLEANLAKTIGDVNGVASARVTLAVPQRTAFLENQPKPSASVMVRLEPGVSLSGAQTAGIVHLVAASVPGLAPEAVSIVDQDGRMLTHVGGDATGEVPEQLSIVRGIDQHYEMLIEGLLTPLVGKDNARVTVDADVDFSHTRRSSVIYGQSHPLSQDETSREHVGAGNDAGGVPGALSNQPPGTPQTPLTITSGSQTITLRPPGANAAASAASGQPPAAEPKAAAPGSKESHAVVNYDIDRTVEYAEDPPWRLKSVAVSVLVNNQTGHAMPVATIDAIKQLVTNAVGAGGKRDVAVIDLPFDSAMNAAVAEPWWRQPWVHVATQNAVLALAGLLALFGFGLPMLRRLQHAPLTFAYAGGMAPAGRYHGAQASGRSVGSSIDVAAIGQNMLDADIDAVRRIVANDPGRTAQVIKEWLSHAGTNKRLD
ncbi:MAG TPA: flagellar basal-body MS-ring/collar protein FliF [Stellaceae bacterium]|nr:flagellar basal-body MS-ring/collar protein FliF [Stellaceae bacterium]